MIFPFCNTGPTGLLLQRAGLIRRFGLSISVVRFDVMLFDAAGKHHAHQKGAPFIPSPPAQSMQAATERTKPRNHHFPQVTLARGGSGTNRCPDQLRRRSAARPPSASNASEVGSGVAFNQNDTTLS
jgi:hypothetical protein